MTRVSLWTSSFLTAFVIGALASSSGCKSTEQVCSDYDCDTGEQLYSCKPTTGFKQYSCQSGDTAAASWCQGIGGGTPVELACEDYAGDGTEDGGSETGAAAPPWDPSTSVTYDSASGTYLVDESFVEMLKGDPGLLFLDGARVDESSAGYYALESVAQGDLAAEMGLLSGDLLVSVNRHDLSSIDSIVDAYFELENETNFTLTVSRNGQTMDLTYQVVDFSQ